MRRGRSPYMTIRPFRWDDLHRLVGMLNLAYEHDGEETRHAPDSLRHAFTWPGYEAERDCYLAVIPGTYYSGERIIGMCDAHLDVKTGRAWGEGIVHPDLRRKGVGRWLLETADFAVRRRKPELPPGKPLYVQRFVASENQGADILLTAAGYTIVRYGYDMHIDLTPDMPPVPMPDGFELRPFHPEMDTRRFYEVHQEAFRDHWGHIDDMPYETWLHYNLEDRDHFDAALWLMAVDSATGDIAGVVINKPVGDDSGEGYVGVLGVRAHWRKRGLGLALLRQSFHLFAQRGWTKAVLSVDAANPTNAVALYERAGMHIHKRRAYYRKVLCGDPSLLVD